MPTRHSALPARGWDGTSPLSLSQLYDMRGRPPSPFKHWAVYSAYSNRSTEAMSKTEEVPEDIQELGAQVLDYAKFNNQRAEKHEDRVKEVEKNLRDVETTVNRVGFGAGALLVRGATSATTPTVAGG